MDGSGNAVGSRRVPSKDFTNAEAGISCFDRGRFAFLEAFRESFWLPSYEYPCILPRIATPLTHLSGLLSKHSTPALVHLAHGLPDRSHWTRRLRHVQHGFMSPFVTLRVLGLTIGRIHTGLGGLLTEPGSAPRPVIGGDDVYAFSPSHLCLGVFELKGSSNYQTVAVLSETRSICIAHPRLQLAHNVCYTENPQGFFNPSKLENLTPYC